MDPCPVEPAGHGPGGMAAHRLLGAVGRPGRRRHGAEEADLGVEEGLDVEELSALGAGQRLPAAGEGLEVDPAAGHDGLDFEEHAALGELDPGVKVGGPGVALRAPHRHRGAGEALDGHGEVEGVQAVHVGAGLADERRRVRWRRAAGAEERDAKPGRREPGGGARAGGTERAHRPLRIRSSPTRRVIFWASNHSSRGST